MNILIIGGAGYIGSHILKTLHIEGFDVTTFDNLHTGNRDAVKYGAYLHVDLCNENELKSLMSLAKYDAVMHFASYIQVSESVQKPDIYYKNNVCNTLNLLNSMVENGINNFIFSSSAAIFGTPEYTPIDESHPRSPINPYGRSKLMIEEILEDYEKAYGLKSVCLRYFNAAGADPDGELGERHDPETHLIPLILQAASGRRESVTVFGTDYDTPDGTCIRDYIHVSDLCDAHLLALEYLKENNQSARFNLGNGDGYSVKEVLDTAEQVVGHPISVGYGDRRPGDPARLVADATLAKEVLGWQPKHADLKEIIQHAWAWEQSFFCNGC
jgi:UDP-glucose 4-epimerase